VDPRARVQATSDGTPFVEVLARQGVLPGIKVDEVGAPGAAEVGEGQGGAAARRQRACAPRFFWQTRRFPAALTHAPDAPTLS
jgi:hypothetical protein